MSATLEDLLDAFKKNVEVGIGSMLTYEMKDARVRLQCDPTKNGYAGIATIKTEGKENNG